MMGKTFLNVLNILYTFDYIYIFKFQNPSGVGGDTIILAELRASKVLIENMWGRSN